MKGLDLLCEILISDPGRGRLRMFPVPSSPMRKRETNFRGVYYTFDFCAEASIVVSHKHGKLVGNSPRLLFQGIYFAHQSHQTISRGK